LREGGGAGLLECTLEKNEVAFWCRGKQDTMTAGTSDVESKISNTRSSPALVNLGIRSFQPEVHGVPCDALPELALSILSVGGGDAALR